MSTHEPSDDHSAMEGGGFYNRNSAIQAAGIAQLTTIWEAACKAVTINFHSSPVTIVDYGSSQGRNSMVPIRLAIDTLRTRAGRMIPIEVVHTDLPSNDFSALFEALVKEPNSYMAGSSGVFPFAIGRSFFETLLAPARVHLGWSTWAMQWMSRNPAQAPDHILAGMSAVPSVMAAVKEQQAADWLRFLQLRSEELLAGGKLLVGFTARTERETGLEWLLGELWSSIVDMGREGLLSPQEEQRITIPIGLRTVEELQAPFRESGSYADLVIEHIELFPVADPFWAEFQRTGDRKAFAKQHADTTRAWAGPTIEKLIDASHNQASLVNELFSRFTQRLEVNPQEHQPYMVAALLTKML